MRRHLVNIWLILATIPIGLCRSMSVAVKESNDIKVKITSINGNCFDNKDCWVGTDDHRVCVEHKCQCKANYAFDYINNLCKYFTCRLDKDCQTYDQNRRCDVYDGCKCIDGYVEDRKSGKCLLRRTIGSPCSAHTECWTDRDTHRVCHQSACQCKLFYEYDSYSRQCVAKNSCDSDEDCHKYDNNRVCDEYGLCICDYGYYADSIGDKCRKVSKPAKSQVWAEKAVTRLLDTTRLLTST